jgi:PAS domain S-box-containing protein
MMNQIEDNFLHRKTNDLFASLKEVAVYITDGKANTIGVNKTYESLTGLMVEEVLGRNMREIEAKGLIDKSVTLLSLKARDTVTVSQKILPTGKKVLVTSNPVFDQLGNIVLVASLLYPMGFRETASVKKESPPSFSSGISDVVFSSDIMRKLLMLVAKVAQTETTVLISGETGVGKEVIAKIIHQLSPRNHKPFIKVNLSSIPEELFESELFGYQYGAFTGALKTGKKGLVQAANGGTLFLDEISEITPGMQIKILRLLQEKEVLPVGSTESKRFDVRFLAATNRDLKTLVQSGKFREDLFYRLHVVPIRIPPLRERKEDIYTLLEYFKNNLCTRYGTKKYFTSTAMQLLMDYSWPGNVRELQNTIERVFAVYSQNEINEEMLFGEIYLEQNPGERKSPVLKSGVHIFERDLINRILRDNKGNLEMTAKSLGVHRTTLLRKLRKYALVKPTSSEH